MELDSTEGTDNQTDGEQQQQPTNSQRGSPPPNILTSAINLIFANCLENQFMPHDLCDENERRVDARFQALLEAADSDPPVRIRLADITKGLWI
jgi:hypothetical protein